MLLENTCIQVRVTNSLLPIVTFIWSIIFPDLLNIHVNTLYYYCITLCVTVINFTWQLRGRVGRADKEAHAHLFYPEKSLLSDQALVSSL